MTARPSQICRALGFEANQYNTWCAVHEAGHTISQLTLGDRIRSVEVRFGSDGLVSGGVARGRRTDPGFLPAVHAGMEAQHVWMERMGLWTPYRMEVVRSTSRRDLAVIDEFTPSSRQKTEHAALARRHVTQEWRQVLRIADALVEHGRLNARDLRRLG